MPNAHPQDPHTHPQHDRKEAISQAIDKAQDVADRLNPKDDRVIHCPKCNGAEKAEKYMKAATVFSLGACILSIVSLALPFLRSIETDNLQKIMDTLETMQEKTGAQTSSAAPTSYKAPSKSAQAAATQASSASSREAASSSAESSAAKEESSSSTADGTGL